MIRNILIVIILLTFTINVYADGFCAKTSGTTDECNGYDVYPTEQETCTAAAIGSTYSTSTPGICGIGSCVGPYGNSVKSICYGPSDREPQPPPDCPWAAPYDPITGMCVPDNNYCVKGVAESVEVSSGWPGSCSSGCVVDWNMKLGNVAYGKQTGAQCSFSPNGDYGGNNPGGSPNPDTDPSNPDNPDPDEPDEPDPTPPAPPDPGPDTDPDEDFTGIIEAVNAANRSITSAVDNARVQITNAINYQTQFLNTALMNVKDGIVNSVNYSRSVLDASINQLKATVDIRLKDVKNQVFTSIDNLGKDLDALLTKINVGIAGLNNDITDAIQGQTTDLIGSISTLKSDLLGALSGQTNSIVEAINGINGTTSGGEGDCLPGDTTAGCSTLGELNDTVDSTSVDLSTFTPGNATTVSGCPSSIPINFGSHSTNVEFTEICNAAESYIRPLVLLFASYAGFMIFTAGLKGG